MERLNHTNTTTKTTDLRYSFIEVVQRPKNGVIFSMLIIVTLLTLIGNAIVCWTVLKTRRLRFSAFYFVASLAVADFLVGLFILPISLGYHVAFEMKGRWIFGSWSCKLWLLANFWFCSASILSLCLISWDRYVAVTSPLHYKTRMSNVKAKRLIAINWTFSFSLAIILITKAQLMTDPNKTNCTILGLKDPIFSGLGVGIVFVIPVIFLIFVNMRVWIVARRHKKRIRTFWDETARFGNIDLNGIPFSSRANGPTPATLDRKRWSLTRTIRQEIRTFKTFLIIIGVLVACWCPFFVYMVLDNVQRLNPFHFYIVILLGYSNSAMNVFIYGIFSVEFRRAMREAICYCGG